IRLIHSHQHSPADFLLLRDGHLLLPLRALRVGARILIDRPTLFELIEEAVVVLGATFAAINHSVGISSRNPYRPIMPSTLGVGLATKGLSLRTKGTRLDNFDWLPESTCPLCKREEAEPYDIDKIGQAGGFSRCFPLYLAMQRLHGDHICVTIHLSSW
ncbi:hypothetical protein CVT26_005215, partial [Gymnopilus dilepis]